MSNWEQHKLDLFYHYAPVWYEGKPAFFIKLQDDNQQVAWISLEGHVIPVNRESLTPRQTRKDLLIAREEH